MSEEKSFYYYQHHTVEGTIGLMPETGGRYKLMFKGENLGSYDSAAIAADVASTGQTKTAADEKLGKLNIPGDLEKWDRKLFATISPLRPA